MNRYDVYCVDDSCWAVIDTKLNKEIAICNDYGSDTDPWTEDSEQRARAIANSLNKTGFDYEPSYLEE